MPLPSTPSNQEFHPTRMVLNMAVTKRRAIWKGRVTYDRDTIYQYRWLLPHQGDLEPLYFYDGGNVPGFDIANFAEDLTIWIGTSDGAKDHGVCRFKGFDSADKMWIVADASASWEAGDYITIFDTHELWPRPQGVHVSVQPPDDWEGPWDWKEGDPIPEGAEVSLYILKDYHAPSSMREDTGVVPIMGSPKCAFIDPDTGVATIHFDGSRSYAVPHDDTEWAAPSGYGGINAWEWWFEGGNPSTSTEKYVTVEYDTPGQYVVRLTCTSEDGRTYSSFRRVFIFARRGYETSEDERPYDNIEISTVSGSLSARGWGTDIRVRGSLASLEAIPTGAQVVLFVSEDTPRDYVLADARSDAGFSSTPTYLVGWVQESTIEVDGETGECVASLRIAGLGEWMQQFSTTSAYFTQVDPEAMSWTSYNELPTRRLWWLLIHWHWTLIRFTDVYLDMDDTTEITGHNFPDGSLADQLSSLEGYTQSTWCTSRLGALVIRKQPNLIEPGKRRIIGLTIATLDENSMTSLRITRNRGMVSRARVEGVAITPSDVYVLGDYYDGYIVQVPERGTGYRGTKLELTGQVLKDESHAVMLAQLLYAWGNRSIDSISVDFSTYVFGLDMARMTVIRITYQPDNAPRGLAFDETPFWITGITEHIDSENGYITLSVTAIPNVEPYGSTLIDKISIDLPEPGTIDDGPWRDVIDVIDAEISPPDDITPGIRGAPTVIDRGSPEELVPGLMGAHGRLRGWRPGQTLVRLYGDDTSVVSAENPGYKEVMDRAVWIAKKSSPKFRATYRIVDVRPTDTEHDASLYTEEDSYRATEDGTITYVSKQYWSYTYTRNDYLVESTLQSTKYVDTQAVFLVPDLLQPTYYAAPSLIVGAGGIYLRKIVLYVRTAPVGSDIIVDIRVNGSSIFAAESPRPAITDGYNYYESPNIVPPFYIEESSILDVDILQVGSDAPGADLTISLWCRQYGQ